MNAQESLIEQLEGMLASKDLSKRAEVLRRVTDLFVQGSGRFSDDQIELFDDVMSALVKNIELAARAALADRLARLPDAQGNVIRALAFHDAIEVAAPVLAQSCRLDEGTLVENARTKSQSHMLATAGRSVLTEAVTDILVNRGNHEVVARLIIAARSFRRLAYRLSSTGRGIIAISRCGSGRAPTFHAVIW